MKTLLLSILLLAAVGVAYPMINEETTNVCSALERRLIIVLSARDRDTSAALLLGALQSALSNGSLVRNMMKQRDPDIPPFLTCGLAYWRVLLDPDQAETVITPPGTPGRRGENARPAGKLSPL